MSTQAPPPPPPAPPTADAPLPAPPPTAAPAAVRTTNLRKVYGSLVALDRMDLEVPVGSVYGLVGPNGAGKSTTFAILAGLVTPTFGAAEVAGFDCSRQPYEVRARLGYMPDALGLYEGLQVDEYLRFFMGAYRVPRRQWNGLTDGLLELVGLEGKRTAAVTSLSRGMKQRLSLARALVHDPDVLILDEPASGLDPRARVELRQLLLGLRDLGKTIVISSHVLADLDEICTDVAIIEAGRLLAQGDPKEIQTSLGGGRRVLVRFLDGTEEEHPVASPTEQRDLLRRLIEEGRDVVECTHVGGLEDLFLRVTEGRLQ